MKKAIITKFTHAEVDDGEAPFGFLKIPQKHEMIRAEGEELTISDGHHTFEELYDHRITLFIALALQISGQPFDDNNKYAVWKSKKHSDGSTYEGWFIMGIGMGKGHQISYHLPLKKWDDTEFAQTLEIAPEYDGHTSEDVLERIKKLK
jgi:hypothetical protein